MNLLHDFKIEGCNFMSDEAKSYICDVCRYIYDPEIGDPDNGILPGTDFEDLPADWVCPDCGSEKEFFSLF